MQDPQDLHVFMNAFFMSFLAGMSEKIPEKTLSDALKKYMK